MGEMARGPCHKNTWTGDRFFPGTDPLATRLATVRRSTVARDAPVRGPVVVLLRRWMGQVGETE